MSLTTALRTWLPSNVHFAVSDPTCDYPLLGSEREAIKNAVSKRQKEFSAGRAAARLALEALGVEPSEIPVGARRAPEWPKGMCGSISHSSSVCVAIVARTEQYVSLGIDCEPAVPLQADLRRTILHNDEMHVSGEIATGLFSMKEALFKTLFPVTEEWMGFQAAKSTMTGQLELTENIGAYRKGSCFDVPTVTVEDHVFAFCSLRNWGL